MRSRFVHKSQHNLRVALGSPDNNIETRAIPEEVLLEKEREEKSKVLRLQPMSDLDLMIRNGWGDTKQKYLPDDWRSRKKNGKR